ncbi:TPA: hypothetical protein ACN32D_002128 [Vibrio parahaemolyticus]|uniref:hypothetical protein n=1 Tax=Vibrio TaxID=662 RepID=UPI0004016C3C|nr:MULTISPECIES: hypothetical protein [Vibrio]KIT46457.1 hypothetical protein H337_06985 [Vibrio parahaemolyticus EN9701121]EGQ7915153.1 hypothetical protein [Vibrio parahaemolyticus]EHB9909288.1 hypothetical protein [Vibrio parahaemolyticus]EIA1794254.1 hypothetical protein [Vibrio parahaemolyticus]EIA1798201.1 hypothetical protein [Vibrio parahaemolyticus]
MDNKELFYNILFDNEKVVVERNIKTPDAFVTVLSVDGVDVIKRTITSTGTVFNLVGEL